MGAPGVEAVYENLRMMFDDARRTRIGLGPVTPFSVRASAGRASESAESVVPCE